MNRLFFLVLVIAFATGGYVFGDETANPASSCATTGQAGGCGSSASASSGSCAAGRDAMAGGTANCDNGDCQKQNGNEMMAQNSQCPKGKANNKSERKNRSNGWSCPMMSMR